MAFTACGGETPGGLQWLEQTRIQTDPVILNWCVAQWTAIIVLYLAVLSWNAALLFELLCFLLVGMSHLGSGGPRFGAGVRM
jgi:hypothetical protein